jgi:hypothetical protein
MFEPASHDRIAVQFAGAEAGTGPLTWGQKAIWQDIQESGSQFSMSGWLELPAGSTIGAAAEIMSGAMGRHAALRMRLATDSSGRPGQEIAGSGQASLDILTLPDDCDPAYAAQYAAGLMDSWPFSRFDFQRDWPLRMAVIRLRGACLHLVWVLSHLAADGGGNVLLLDDLLADEATRRAASERRPKLLDVARSEQTAQLRQLSDRSMRYWESQLRRVPAQTFGPPASPPGQEGSRYSQVRFTSPAAHLAMLAIAGRTGTDASRVTLAVIATAIGRAIGVHPLTVKVAVNNRFRPGLADLIAPVSQNAVLTIDVTDTTVDDVVARTRGAALAAGMRAYYDPDALSEVTARVDAERGYPARVTCRVNDQRAMVMRAKAADGPAGVTPEQIRQKLTESALTWLGPRDHLLDQAFIVVENRPDVVSLHVLWDRWSLSSEQIEAFLRSVEEVAVEAAFDPAAPTKVRSAATEGTGQAPR